MTDRHSYLDRGVAEVRGLITLDGRPERLFIERQGDDERMRVGARLVAQVSVVEAALGSAFVDLGGGAQAILDFKPDQRPIRGSALEVEVRGAPRSGKLATVRAIGPADGKPRLLQAAPPLEDLLTSLLRGVRPAEGREAREFADAAEAEALETIHPLPGGGSLAIEVTRALTAIDVDLGERKNADAKRNARHGNLVALGEAARLLRLKSIGGLVVVDLVGRGHDGAALLAAARLAFSPDNPGVAIGPIGRFGTMELSIPRRTPPLSELLCRPDGALSDRTLAHRLIRRVLAEGAAQPGAQLVAMCAPAIAAAAGALSPALAERIGARFIVIPQPEWRRDQWDVVVR